MENSANSKRRAPGRSLISILGAGFRDAKRAHALIQKFFLQSTFDRQFCLGLLSLTRNQDASWELRRLAVLMLENQILKLDPQSLDDFDFLFVNLGLKQRLGSQNPLHDWLLKEGYSTINLAEFIREFRNRLQRLNRIHHGIRGKNTTQAALADFIHLSRRDCKLTLARYLFTPEEVVEEILRQLRVTGGIRDLNVHQPRFVDDESRHAVKTLPSFEAEILKMLCESSDVYWVTDATSAEINSLLEYPAGTVVLVIKPPGSDLEFEIKRAGRRGKSALSVVYARDGYTVPPSHRLDGGSMQGMLRYEANSASRLRLIYRLVHQTEPPMPGYLSRTTVYLIPTKDDSVPPSSYFTEPQFFGPGFKEMRAAMAHCVAAFKDEDQANLPQLAGDLAITAEFLSHVAPTQAILSNTSAFRLDKLANYLSNDGDQIYFNDIGLSTNKPDDARRLADELLEEILGCYRPPKARFKSYETYLEAALSLAENRSRANQVYLSLVQQIGKFWGTLLALRGHSGGESFVARNVGLKTVWRHGEWHVQVIFMDHDALWLPTSEDDYFYPESGIKSMVADERYVWERERPNHFKASELGCLNRIYRVEKDLDAKGRAYGLEALRAAYKKTQHELLTNEVLKKLFDKRFLDRLLDWDNLVEDYFRINGDREAAARWRRAEKKRWHNKGCGRNAFKTSLKIVEKNQEFLERYYELFANSNPISMVACS